MSNEALYGCPCGWCGNKADVEDGPDNVWRCPMCGKQVHYLWDVRLDDDPPSFEVIGHVTVTEVTGGNEHGERAQ